MASPISDAMAGMTPEQRAAYKASVYASRPTPDNLIAGTRIVSIIEGPDLVNGLLRVVLALWIDSGVGFELIDLGDFNPLYFRNPPILFPDPNGDIVRTFTDAAGVTHEARYREDPDTALMQACLEATEGFTGGGGEM